MAQDSPVGSKRHHEDISLGCGEGKSKFERTHAREHAVHICTGAYKPALAASTIDEKADMKGPISTSNWVIPGRLIAGSYPGSKESDAQHRDTISSIIDAGVTAIVCLMPEEELAKCKLSPYKEIALQYAKEKKQRDVEFLTFPITDGYVAEDSAVLEFIPRLAAKVATQSECVYVHCMGGHGRTGTIVALLLAQLYGVSAKRALELTALFHQQRVVRSSRRSPKTRVQFSQVGRLTARLHGSSDAAAGSWREDDGLMPPRLKVPRVYTGGICIIFEDDDDD